LSIGLCFCLLLPSALLHAAGYYHTAGNRILDAQGRPAHFNGIAWVGFETSDGVFRGLTVRSLDSYLDQMQALGFNLLRIPWSDEIFKPLGPEVKLSIDYKLNPDLAGRGPLEVLDKVVEKAGARGIQILLTRQVILDMRGSIGKTQPELWYTPSLSEQTWIEHWQLLARRYLTNPTVMGADLHNEPHGRATWGSGDLKTDWRLAAERAGNAILEIQPNWLIMVQGLERFDNDAYWWGGNLMGVAQYPVRLKVPHRLVYSAHDYGPSVCRQRWFDAWTFPANMAGIWDKHWGYIQRQGLAPVFVGEFGGRGVDPKTETDRYLRKEAQWQNALVDYIRDQQLYWVYWCWNTGGDTGGLLQSDWKEIRAPKYQMLQRVMRPGPTTGQ
jgi:endoglucanase